MNEGGTAGPRRLSAWACGAAIRLYQAWISPWLGPCCRFQPTCSEYARMAIERHGLLRGARLAFLRLFRCRPGFAGGDDPVPGAEYFQLPTFAKSEDSHE